MPQPMEKPATDSIMVTPVSASNRCQFAAAARAISVGCGSMIRFTWNKGILICHNPKNTKSVTRGTITVLIPIAFADIGRVPRILADLSATRLADAETEH